MVIECEKVDIKPAAVTANLTGSVETNSSRSNCEQGYTGNIGLEDIKATGEFSVDNFTVSYTWPLYPEVGSLDYGWTYSEGDGSVSD